MSPQIFETVDLMTRGFTPEYGNRFSGVLDITIRSGADLGGLRIQLVTYAGAALLVLLVATALSMYKPRGWTRYGWRKHHEQRTVPQP